MGQVIRFKKPRGESVRGVARKLLTEAIKEVGGNPKAVVIVAWGDDNWAIRVSTSPDVLFFDALARAEALCQLQKMAGLEPTDDE
jgi:hypothetical protein